jgi:hypothetical protein
MAQVTYLVVFLSVLMDASVLTLWTGCAFASVASLIGLWRRVEWARCLSDAVLFCLVFVVFANLLPISGRPNSHFLEQLLGFMPGTGVLWLGIVVTSAALLAPVALMSSQRLYFRKAWW